MAGHRGSGGGLMRVLLTGACGFIGSNLVEFLLRERPDWQIIVVDALSYAGRRDNIPLRVAPDRLLFVRASIDDATAMSDLAEQCDAMINLAGETHVDNSLTDPGRFVDVNAKGAQVVFDAARRGGVKRVVHISTSEVYGTCQADPMDETHPLEPRSPYAASKLAGDRLARSYWHTYQFPVVIIRPFNNYGPRQHPEKLIPQILTKLLSEQTYLIHGDGSATRDWLFVEDTCRGILRALETPGIEGEVFNLGTGWDISVLEIAQQLEAETGRSGLRRHTEDRPGQVARHRANAEKAERLLGWTPQIAIDEGLAKTAAWYQEHREWWEVGEKEERPKVGAAT